MSAALETRSGLFARFVLISAILGVVAVLTPPPQFSDRQIFESGGRHPFAERCADVHCFRVVVPWVMERMPGASLVKMRVYAVLFNAGAAVAVGYVGLLLGLLVSAARSAVWLSALGTGALATISNPYTADPVMFLLGPLLTALLLRDRIAIAGGIAGFGIFAKEFAAAPLWVFTLYAWRAGRLNERARVLTTAIAVTLMWLAFHLVLLTSGHAGYGDNPSTRLLAGGYLRVWFRELGARGAIAAIFSTFGDSTC